MVRRSAGRYRQSVIRRPILLGVPAAIIWLLFFLASPLAAAIALLVAIAWREHSSRRAAINPRPPDEGHGPVVPMGMRADELQQPQSP